MDDKLVRLAGFPASSGESSDLIHEKLNETCAFVLRGVMFGILEA